MAQLEDMYMDISDESENRADLRYWKASQLEPVIFNKNAQADHYVTQGLHFWAANKEEEAIDSFMQAEKLFNEFWEELKRDEFMITWNNFGTQSMCNKWLQFILAFNKNTEIRALEMAETGKSRALKCKV